MSTKLVEEPKKFIVKVLQRVTMTDQDQQRLALDIELALEWVNKLSMEEEMLILNTTQSVTSFALPVQSSEPGVTALPFATVILTFMRVSRKQMEQEQMRQTLAGANLPRGRG